jgi:hypothetical protein
LLHRPLCALCSFPSVQVQRLILFLHFLLLCLIRWATKPKFHCRPAYQRYIQLNPSILTISSTILSRFILSNRSVYIIGVCNQLFLHFQWTPPIAHHRRDYRRPKERSVYVENQKVISIHHRQHPSTLQIMQPMVVLIPSFNPWQYISS